MQTLSSKARGRRVPQGTALWLSCIIPRLTLSTAHFPYRKYAFTSLTALTDEEADEIIERHVSPLRVTLHCITPEVRRTMIGLLRAEIAFSEESMFGVGY